MYHNKTYFFYSIHIMTIRVCGLRVPFFIRVIVFQYYSSPIGAKFCTCKIRKTYITNVQFKYSPSLSFSYSPLFSPLFDLTVVLISGNNAQGRRVKATSSCWKQSGKVDLITRRKSEFSRTNVERRRESSLLLAARRARSKCSENLRIG